MIPILIRIILTPIVFLGDTLINLTSVLMLILLAQERCELKPRNHEKTYYESGLEATKSLWKRPFYKNQ